MDTKNDIELLDRLAVATINIALDAYNSSFGTVCNRDADFLPPRDLRPVFEWCVSVANSRSGREIDDLPGRVDYERQISDWAEKMSMARPRFPRDVSGSSAALLGTALDLSGLLNRYRQGHGICYEYRKDLFVPELSKAICAITRAAYDLGRRDSQ
ncbi:MAG: hypothetical protein WC992_05895 [Acholeplasmataceae bacterium]